MSKLIYSDSLQRDIVNYTTNYQCIHKENMKWVFKDIQNNPKCQSCNKQIIKYIYSDRSGEIICCSSNCVDQYMYGTTYYATKD